MFATPVILHLFSLISLSTQLAINSTKNCKPLPSTPDWPPLSSWQALNISLSGRLIAALPPAVVCDATKPIYYDGAACSEVGNRWPNSSFHSDDPVSVAYPNWQNDACLPTAIYNRSSSCVTDIFPRYVVNASSAAHVVGAVKFAEETGVRLVAKGGAHDLLGRSTAPSSLSIWTRHLQGTHFQSPFSAINCPKVTNEAAITVSAGNSMRDIYAATTAQNRTIVGAADPNVGIGGYLTGGGHSPLSGVYGLAADNVLELSIVTPSGDIVTANACQNSDIFWAIRGGGGATFGVLLNATLRTFPIPSLTIAVLTFNSTIASAVHNGNNDFYSAAAYFHTQLPTLSADGLMGYYSTMPLSSASPNLTAPRNFAFLLLAVDLTPSAVNFSLQPIMQRLEASNEITSSLQLQGPVNYEAFREVKFTAASVGTNYLAGSRLWDERAVRDEKGVESVLRTFKDDYLQGSFISGPGVRAVDPDESAVNPAWRRTIIHMMAQASYPFKDRKARGVAANYLTKTLTQALRSQAPDTGCYVNEADVHEPDYQQTFWGDHYQRLLALKRRLDPKGVFWCPVCVGGEDWAESSSGRVCRT